MIELTSIIQTLDTIALAFGYLALAGILLVVLSPVLNYLAWVTSSQEAKQMGVAVDKESELNIGTGFAASISDELLDAMKELQDDIDLEVEEKRIGQFDWSTGSNVREQDVWAIVDAIESSGYHVRPFPRSPDDMPSEEWHWSTKNAGIYQTEPTYRLETDEKSEELNPDLERWDIEI